MKENQGYLNRYNAFRADIRDRATSLGIEETQLMILLSPEGAKTLRALHCWVELNEFVQT